MRLHHVVAAGALVAILGACGPATVAPGASTPLTSTVNAVPSVPPIGVGGKTVDAAGLAETLTAKMCALLTPDEAKQILGKDLVGTPDGTTFKGLGTNCIWQSDDTMAPGTFIKVEINPFPVTTNTDLLTLGGVAAVPVSVAGFDALGVDVGGLQKDASLVIRLSDPAKPPSMLIQAPTLAQARAVAEKVLPRIGSLK
jgi:hypothetical protein